MRIFRSAGLGMEDEYEFGEFIEKVDIEAQSICSDESEKKSCQGHVDIVEMWNYAFSFILLGRY